MNASLETVNLLVLWEFFGQCSSFQTWKKDHTPKLIEARHTIMTSFVIFIHARQT